MRGDECSITVPERFVIGYFSQDPAADTEATVLESTLAGTGDLGTLEALIATCSEQLADPELDADRMTEILEKMGEAQAEFEAKGGYDVEARAEVILGGLGFRRDDLHKPVRAFSGGWRMRIELAKVLLVQPDALLLDEPTNHLDVESIIWLEEFLSQFKATIFMTSHDRDFMNRLVKKVVALEWGQINLYSGNFDFYERESRLRLDNLEAAADRQEAFLEKEEKFIARFKARASHASQVQSRVKMLEKMDRIEIPKEPKPVDLRWLPCQRSGEIVADISNLDKAFGDKRVLQGVSFKVSRLDRIALLGVNGAGKSTLLKIMAGELDPDGGVCRIGASLQMGYFAQHQAEILDPARTAFEAVQEVVPTVNRGVIQNLLGSLRFTGDDVDKKISVLSGGEKTRLVLARIIAKPVNFLILDEPTNHLDMKSREILLEALENFDGTVVFVSHDRHFLRRLATKVVLLDQGHTTEFPGGLGYFLEKSGFKLPGSEYTLRLA